MRIQNLRDRPRFVGMSVWRYRSPIGFVLGVAIVFTMGHATAAAQAAFAWPDTAVDVSRYQTVEECIAATNRVNTSDAKRNRIATGIWVDTMAYDPVKESPLGAASPFLVTTASQCMARYKDLDELMKVPDPPRPFTSPRYGFFWRVMTMYLRANRDADAAAYLAKRIAAAPTEREELEQTAITVYEKARPMRLAALEAIYRDRVAKLDSSAVSLGQFNLYGRLLKLALLRGDTAQARKYTQRATELWPKLPANTRLDYLAPEYIKPIGEEQFTVFESFRRAELMDTLRRQGTARYLAAVAGYFEKLAGVAPGGIDKFSKLDQFHRLTGKPAPAIVGDFWYRRGDSTAPRPTKGKVGLVLFLDPSPPGRFKASPAVTDSVPNESHCLPYRSSREELEAQYKHREDKRGEDPKCWEILAVVKRLAQRFPDLEITVVAQTYGSFVYTAYSKDQAKEAEVIRRWLHDVHGVPGALAVTSTAYDYRPEPDGRRVAHRKTPNTDNYFSGLGESWSYRVRVLYETMYTPVIPAGSTFLVDRDGIIATAMQVRRAAEPELAAFVDALLRQGKP